MNYEKEYEQKGGGTILERSEAYKTFVLEEWRMPSAKSKSFLVSWSIGCYNFKT